MLTLLLTITNALSAEPVESQLAKCDLALTAKIQEAQLCSLGVQLRSDELERVTKENAQLRSRGTGLFDNVFVWATLGTILGVYAGSRATR